MKLLRKLSIVTTFVFLITIVVYLSVGYIEKTSVLKYNESYIGSWPENSKNVAKDIINKYGKPNEFNSNMIIWYNNGIWKRTIVYREGKAHNFPMDHYDVIEQTINYKVPIDKFDKLACFDGSLVCNRTAGEITISGSWENFNILSLNLANDIIEEKRTIENARNFFTSTVQNIVKGKTSSYIERLLFPHNNNHTNDPDISLVQIN